MVVTDRLFLRTEGYLRFSGNRLYIIFGRNVLEAANWVVTARLWWRSDDYLRFGGNWLYIIFRWIVLEASDLVVMDRLFLWTAGYLRFGGDWHHIIFGWIVLNFFQTFRIFFGARFRYKSMYYNLYHVSDLRKIIQFLRKIKCIEFECNKFVLVLVQIDLIHFEHSNCISSTLTKTNINSLHSRSIHSISRKIGHVIQIVEHQFVCKMISIFKLY